MTSKFQDIGLHTLPDIHFISLEYHELTVASLTLIENRTEGDATGPQSLSGKGLRIYAQRVCDRVKAKGSTSYNEVGRVNR